jgi:hypothetical protein
MRARNLVASAAADYGHPRKDPMADDRLDKERQSTLKQIRRAANGARRAELTEAYFRHTGGVVQAGPFAGMKLLQDAAWRDGDVLPKLLGCYEAELHPAIERRITAGPKRILNVGAAEGYYSIGLARRLPDAEVISYETSDASRGFAAQAAAENQVRVDHRATCDLAELAAVTVEPSFVVMDCEGAEARLLDPAAVPGLARCDILVECHDFFDRALTRTLVARLSPTHRIERIEEGPRDPNKNPWLRRFNSADRWLAVNEGRPETMHWLVCTPKPAST